MSFSSATNSISAIGLVDQPRVEFVQLDSLVVMKIVKHGDIEFYAGMSKIAGETCQGILTGLIAIEDRKLEVTNCFSTTRPDVLLEGEEAGMQDAAALEENKQNEILEMLKRFRTMNIDYELVGFYQAHPFGACFNHDMMESLVDYQMSQQNGVVLIYDPIRTRQGNLTIRAYRLSRKALELALNGEWTPELTKQAGLNFANFFEELPVVVKNSHLMNVLLAELALANNGKKAASQLELGTKRSLERSMKAMMGTVDELNKSVNAYTKYSMEKQKYDAVLNTLLQKRIVENETRQTRGEPPLSLDEIRKQLKQPQMLAKNGMLDLFLSALDTNAYSKFQIEATSESIAKLHLSQAVTSQQPNPAAAAAFGGNLQQQQTAAPGSNERR